MTYPINLQKQSEIAKLPHNGRNARKKGLTRQRIIEAGLDVMRSSGPEALTMKRVADTLGSGTMSLYRHIDDRDDLIAGMLDHEAKALVFPPQNAEPSQDIVAVFGTLYTAFRKNPWIVQELIARQVGSNHILPAIERVILALETLKFAPADAYHIYYTLMHYTYGEALVMSAAEKNPAADQPALDAGFQQAFPAMARSFTAAAALGQDPEPFEANVRRLLGNLTGT